MRNTRTALCLLLLASTGLTAQERADEAMVAKIKAEGYGNSKAAETFTYLTTAIGPRLTNSPAHRRPIDWTQERLRSYGTNMDTDERVSKDGLEQAAVVMLVASGLVAAQNARSFRARLSPVPIDLTMQATIAGTGSATATLEANTLTISGTFQNLRSPATVARVHRAYRGTRGPAFADLKVSGGTSGIINGSIALTKEQIGDLGKSLFYVQLHSEKAPDGNLWGWLLPVEGKTK